MMQVSRCTWELYVMKQWDIVCIRPTGDRKFGTCEYEQYQSEPEGSIELSGTKSSAGDSSVTLESQEFRTSTDAGLSTARFEQKPSSVIVNFRQRDERCRALAYSLRYFSYYERSKFLHTLASPRYEAPRRGILPPFFRWQGFYLAASYLSVQWAICAANYDLISNTVRTIERLCDRGNAWPGTTHALFWGTWGHTNLPAARLGSPVLLCKHRGV
ncbi:hypothetical protein BKA66DRAFT_145416 [Pyrenochaeta sp. MPI-SDFR-AT-0127]|nr:hypothetical protein BKA66DRAFT_145416 [Pyrenochaeta sp. MPI-SDFR-AT-0127]